MLFFVGSGAIQHKFKIMNMPKIHKNSYMPGQSLYTCLTSQYFSYQTDNIKLMRLIHNYWIDNRAFAADNNKHV